MRETAAHVGGTDVHGILGFLTDARVDHLNDDVFCKSDWFAQLRRYISVLTAWYGCSIFWLNIYIALFSLFHRRFFINILNILKTE